MRCALKAHPAWDLLHLLQDARRDVSPELEAAMLDRFLAARPGLDREAFQHEYRALATSNAAGGDPDPTFGQGGKVAATFDGHGSAGAALALQPDGKLLVVGSSPVFAIGPFGDRSSTSPCCARMPAG